MAAVSAQERFWLLGCWDSSPIAVLLCKRMLKILAQKKSLQEQ
jgi:hypothetical protein